MVDMDQLGRWASDIQDVIDFLDNKNDEFLKADLCRIETEIRHAYLDWIHEEASS